MWILSLSVIILAYMCIYTHEELTYHIIISILLDLWWHSHQHSSPCTELH